MKIVFMGTPEFAVKTLEACIANHEVVAVFTQPDKPKGRGNKMTPSEVKVVAEKYGIPVLQPDKIRKDNWADVIRSYAPDVTVVVAYGQLLSQEILDIPQYGSINVHASLLPKYRGAAPINWAIAHGEKVTGVTTMLMDAGLDTGDMLLKSYVEIDEDMTAQELHDLLASSGAELLIETLTGIEQETLKPEKQDSNDSCYASMLNKEIARIDWSMRSSEIRNRIRAFNPWPVAHTTLESLALKVYKATLIDALDTAIGTGTEINYDRVMPGTVVKTDKFGIYVKTGDGLLRLDEVQWGSNKRMAAQAFLLGKTIDTGTQLY